MAAPFLARLLREKWGLLSCSLSSKKALGYFGNTISDLGLVIL